MLSIDPYMQLASHLHMGMTMIKAQLERVSRAGRMADPGIFAWL
jgi:hypothetical protein